MAGRCCRTAKKAPSRVKEKQRGEGCLGKSRKEGRAELGIAGRERGGDHAHESKGWVQDMAGKEVALDHRGLRRPPS